MSKKIMCPNCGKIRFYAMPETETRLRQYDADGTPSETVADSVVDVRNVKICPVCFNPVKIVEEDEE